MSAAGQGGDTVKPDPDEPDPDEPDPPEPDPDEPGAADGGPAELAAELDAELDDAGAKERRGRAASVTPSSAGPPASASPRLALASPEAAGGGVAGSLVEAALARWPVVDGEVLDDVVAAGETAYARAAVDPRDPVAASAPSTALARTREATEAARVVARAADRHHPGQASWALGGVVIPVLGASAGVGASVVAAALFDALDASGVPTLLVDGADPARSGLASAVASQGAPARSLHETVKVSYARRGDGWVAQLCAPPTEVLSARMVPAPSWWLPDTTAPGATVVDLGWDPWAVAAAPLRGAGAWLENGTPSSPRPVLVVRPTRPSLARANELMTRLRPWIAAGQIAKPAALVVVGARRWPRGVAGVAVRDLGDLVEHAVFVPTDSSVSLAGIGPDPVPYRLQSAAAAVPARWGLIADRVAPGGVSPSLLSRFQRGR